MHKTCDVPQTPSEHSGIEYYKTLAHLAEERAREIRRISALDRALLEKRLLEQELLIRNSVDELERLKAEQAHLNNSHGRLRERFEGVQKKAERLRGDLSVAKAELRKIKRTQDRVIGSRAHRLAAAYVRFTSSHILNRVRRALHR